MQIHLSDITDSEGKIIKTTAPLEMDSIHFQLGDFPILQKSPVELTIANTGNKVLELEGSGSITAGIPCDRCLEQVSVEIPYSNPSRYSSRLSLTISLATAINASCKVAASFSSRA